MDRAKLIEVATSMGFDPDELSRMPTYDIERRVGKPVVQTEIIDTAATLIEMPQCANVGDKNYERMKYLVDTQQKLQMSVDANTTALNNCATEWEPDDLLVLRKEVEDAQLKIRVIAPEIQELNVWFAAQRAQKLEFYKSVAPKLVDVSGNLANHFGPKMQRMGNQLRSLR